MWGNLPQKENYLSSLGKIVPTMSKELLELEEDFRECWEMLNEHQKRSVLDIARVIRDEPDKDFLKKYNEDIDMALAEIEAGNYHTHEEVVKMLEEDGKYGG
jgi:predicted transcriptional regulator